MSRKPQALLLLGASVRICKHRRQVGSEFASFLDSFWREDEPWVVLQLPDGQRTAVPASWTDLSAEGFAQTKGQPELLPSALLGLARYCQRLRPRRKKRPHPKGSLPGRK
jgi:hypothetical protein